jgi:2'-5' RNA ligase
MKVKGKLTAFKVETFNLMMSSLNPGGPVYSILDTFTLNG